MRLQKKIWIRFLIDLEFVTFKIEYIIDKI